MSNLKTRPWDAVDHLKTEEDMAAYLEAALEEDDPELISAVLGDIARAKGLSEVADRSGLSPEELSQKMLPDGKPDFATVLKIVRALGLRFHATTATG